jgi:hypothetical protein
MHVLIRWLTYVPDDLETPERFGPGHLWWRLKEERHAMHKVVVSRALVETPAAVITDGNHLVSEPSAATPPRHARLPADVVACAHCPVRSREQLCAKVITGYLADLAAHAPGREFAHHWGELYNEIASGGAITAEMLRDIACNYTLPRAKWRAAAAVELVEDPLPLGFELRYPSNAHPDPLRRLMRFTEALIMEQRRRRAAPAAAIP